MSEPLFIRPRPHDLGDFAVRRVLPFAQKRMVGPFIFFDHMGPAVFPPGKGIAVRPHPHIGLATLTYLFEGQFLHRDSLGTHQPIDPGDVNWMIAGSGIVHSERVSDIVMARGQTAHGLQIWIALPREAEEMAPEFHHYSASTLPRLTVDDAQVTLIAGRAFDAISPVKCLSPLFYGDITLPAGGRMCLYVEAKEKAIYLLEGAIAADGTEMAPGEMLVWSEGEMPLITTDRLSHFVVLGGEPFPEGRHIYWNFVSSSKERLEQAKNDWREGRFVKVPGDEIEFIPLPE